tara:strand:+ start:1470 stop:1793 length:324 start_codon:yes stop_codon:yes gene_type:complete
MSERNTTIVNLDTLGQIEEEIENIQQFGEAVKGILESVMGHNRQPISIEGDKAKVDAFVEALKGEKELIEAHNKHGEDHPEIIEAQKVVEIKTGNFEDIVGVDWPLR